MLNTSRSPLPGKYDTLLLRAALLSGHLALDAYYEWRKTLDLDALDFGSQRVLPLLVKNLSAHGIDDPIMDRFRGVGRFAWLLNQVLINAVRPVLSALNQANTPFVLLKGVAFIASLPKQLPLRAMTDIDLLVHKDDAASAIGILEASGWRPYYGRAKFVRNELIDRAISCDFQHGQHGHLDLHWYVLERNRWPNADAALWSRVKSVELAGEQCYAPCFEDQVLHAFVHGAPWNGIGTIRWVTDSIILLRNKTETFDWNYFLNQCRSRRVAIQARNCLRYLREQLDVPVPDHVMSELHQERVSLVELLEYKLRAKNPVTLIRPATALVSFQIYRGSNLALANADTIAALCHWIKHIWDADSAMEAAALALLASVGRPPWLRKLMSRIWRREGRLAILGPRSAPNLQDGPIDLSLWGDPKGAVLYGWSEPETGGRWTDGPEAALVFELSAERASQSIVFSVFAMVTESAPKLKVEIWVNRQRCEDWSFGLDHARLHTRRLTIPESALAYRHQVLTFVIRHPKSPQSLGKSTDVRRLGLFVNQFGLEAIPYRDNPGHGPLFKPTTLPVPRRTD